MTQSALFMLRNTWISQGMNGATSHLGTKAIDFGWLSAKPDYILYAPFDGHIVYKDVASKGAAIAFQSDEPVLYADGTVDYMTVITAHDNTPPAVGSAFKQGEKYSKMGTAGGVGKHCHVEVQKGKFEIYHSRTSQGYYKWPNTVAPYLALWLVPGTNIKDETSVAHYTWRVWQNVPQPVPRDIYSDQVRVLADGLRIRNTPSTNGRIAGYVEKLGCYDVFDIKETDQYTWYEIGEGFWIAGKEGWTEFMESKYEKLYKDLQILYNNLLEEKDITANELAKMTASRDKYQAANKKKLAVINKVKKILLKTTIDDSGKVKQIDRTVNPE